MDDKHTDYECEKEILKNIGLKGTAKPISVLKLVADEEKERKKCLTKAKKHSN